MTTTLPTNLEIERPNVLTYKDMWKSGNADAMVTYILRQLGIPCHVKGFQYTKRAIVLVIEDSSYLHSITKRLYLDLAKEFHTSAPRVERAMRHSIELIYCDDNLKETYLGFAKDSYTNSEFIATVAELVKLNINNK